MADPISYDCSMILKIHSTARRLIMGSSSSLCSPSPGSEPCRSALLPPFALRGEEHTPYTRRDHGNTGKHTAFFSSLLTTSLCRHVTTSLRRRSRSVHAISRLFTLFFGGGGGLPRTTSVFRGLFEAETHLISHETRQTQKNTPEKNIFLLRALDQAVRRETTRVFR